MASDPPQGVGRNARECRLALAKPPGEGMPSRGARRRWHLVGVRSPSLGGIWSSSARAARLLVSAGADPPAAQAGCRAGMGLLRRRRELRHPAQPGRASLLDDMESESLIGNRRVARLAADTVPRHLLPAPPDRTTLRLESSLA